MPELSKRPGSSTKRQRQTLAIAGKKAGYDIHELRRLVGGSISKLSALDCSEWITRISGRALPNKPGTNSRRSEYTDKKPGGIRIITGAQEEQIHRLMIKYFEDEGHGMAWLKKSFKVDTIRELGTAKRAGEVIAALKRMIRRVEAA